MAGPNADVLFPFYHSSVYENPVNGFAFYYDNELDRLLEGARADFDPQGRVEKWRAAQKIIMDAALNIPLAVAMNFSLYDLGTDGRKRMERRGASPPRERPLFHQGRVALQARLVSR